MANANPSTPGVSALPILPLVSGSPEEVARGVFVVPDHRVPLVPNIGVIVGDRAALVVDTGIGPRNGAVVRPPAIPSATRTFAPGTSLLPRSSLTRRPPGGSSARRIALGAGEAGRAPQASSGARPS